MATCKGRLAAIELPDKTPVAFESIANGKKPVLFSIPKVCAGTAERDGLCRACLERSARTATAVEKRGGKYVPNQQILLHGRFGEPLPAWSHMFGGAWFCQTQAEKGLKIPAAVAAAIKAVEPKSGPVEPVEMPPKRVAAGAPTGEPTAQIVGADKPKAKRTTKKVAAAPAIEIVPLKTAVVDVSAAPNVAAPSVAAPVAAPSEAAPAPKKFAPKRTKKAEAAAPTPIAIIKPTPLDVEVLEVKVRKIEIDGRTVYLSPEKDKVYDMKFNYIGRYNRRDDKIDSRYADSDRE